MAAKRAASLRARFALITHCTKGHPYDEANTMINQGKRVCREKRRQRAAIQSARDKDKAQRLAYAATHKAEKQAYDVARKPLANEQRKERRANETPEQREHRLRQKRESHQRNREAAIIKMREHYRLRQAR